MGKGNRRYGLMADNLIEATGEWYKCGVATTKGNSDKCGKKAIR